MELFSDSPKSFKIKKKNSPLVEELKSAILQELGSNADEYLAEYIIVLISNGKHQFQAREALEAFLDEGSGEFVSWLWNLLLKYAQQSDSDIHLVGTKGAAMENELISGQAEGVQRLESLIVNHNAPSQVLDRPGTSISRTFLPHITDNLQGKEIAEKRICSRSLLEDSSTISSHSKKLRGRVWDRLGWPVEQKNVGTDEMAKYQVLNQNKLSPTQRTSTVSKENSTLDVTAKDNFYGENSTGRKSHFGEMSTGTSFPLVSSEKMDIQNKEILQAKKSPSTSRKEEMQSIKQKLHQAEQEICKLRIKQMDVEKRAQSRSVSNAGMDNTSLEDTSSRTVLVTNVTQHNLFFLLISFYELKNCCLRRSAYITFADVVSVDKAVALSGTSIFSRTLKIIKKTDQVVSTLQ